MGKEEQRKEQFINMLYGTYAPALRRFCARYVHYRHEYDGVIEECVQDVFMCAYREYDTLKTHPNIPGWLYKACDYRMRNRVTAIQRRLKRMQNMQSLENEASIDDTERFIEKTCAGEAINRFFDTLTEREKQLLYSRYIKEEPIRDVALKMGMNENTVKVTLMRLRRRAQKFFEASRHLLTAFIIAFFFKSFH